MPDFKAAVEYTGDGSQTLFTFNFGYLLRDHVSVTVDGQEVSFSFLNDNTVSLDVAPEGGSYILISRNTPNEDPFADFTDGTTLSERELDAASEAARFSIQEMEDSLSGTIQVTPEGFTDGLGYTLRNIGPPVLQDDAVSLEYVLNLANANYFAIGDHTEPSALAQLLTSAYLAGLENGDGGPDDGNRVFLTAIDAQAADLAGVTSVSTLGYHKVGDGGEATYHAVDTPTVAGGFTSPDGVHFALASPMPWTPEQFGANQFDQTHDDWPAFEAMKALAGVTDFGATTIGNGLEIRLVKAPDPEVVTISNPGPSNNGYTIGQPIVFSSSEDYSGRVAMFGEGNQICTILPLGGALSTQNLITIEATTGNARNFTFKDFRLRWGQALRLDGDEYCVFERIQFHQGRGDADIIADNKGFDTSKFIDCWHFESTGDIFKDEGGGSSMSWYSCLFGENTGGFLFGSGIYALHDCRLFGARPLVTDATEVSGSTRTDTTVGSSIFTMESTTRLTISGGSFGETGDYDNIFYVKNINSGPVYLVGGVRFFVRDGARFMVTGNEQSPGGYSNHKFDCDIQCEGDAELFMSTQGPALEERRIHNSDFDGLLIRVLNGSNVITENIFDASLGNYTSGMRVFSLDNLNT